MPTLVLAVASGMVLATAAIAADILPLRTMTAWLLCAYLVAFTEVVCLVLALSLVGQLLSWALFGGVASILLVACAARYRLPGRPTARSRLEVQALRELGGDPIVAALFAVSGAALAYSTALVLFTPPNDWDALTYHLSRAAFWIQQHGVGYVPDSDVVRIDVNPPNGEIGFLFTMLLSDGDRYVGFVQLAALLACGVGVYGVARRCALASREAAFGALVFVTLPIAVLQSSAALNDLVVASFLVAATYFLLGSTRSELALGGLGAALAVGTKFTAYIAIPLLLLVVLAGQPRRRRLEAGAAALGGAAVGSYWLVVNVVETGRPDGGAGEELDQLPDRSPDAVLARFSRMLANVVDDMNLGPDVRVYAITAIVLAVVVAVRKSGCGAWASGAAIAAIGLVPLVLARGHELAVRFHEKLWLRLGRDDLAFLDPNRETWSPSTVYSYYGPPGLVLMFLGIALAVLHWRRAGSGYVALVATAPLILMTLVALALVYDPWRARFLLYGFALAASAWGIMLRHRFAAWSATSLAAVTVLLAFVHSIEKPAGITIFDSTTRAGVWGEPREAVQTWLRQDDTAEIVRYFAGQAPTGHVGLELAEDDWIYHYFGRELDRHVTFAVDTSHPGDALDWLVTRRGRPPSDWSPALETERGWRVYVREIEGYRLAP